MAQPTANVVNTQLPELMHITVPSADSRRRSTDYLVFKGIFKPLDRLSDHHIVRDANLLLECGYQPQRHIHLFVKTQGQQDRLICTAGVTNIGQLRSKIYWENGWQYPGPELPTRVAYNIHYQSNPLPDPQPLRDAAIPDGHVIELRCPDHTDPNHTHVYVGHNVSDMVSMCVLLNETVGELRKKVHGIFRAEPRHQQLNCKGVLLQSEEATLNEAGIREADKNELVVRESLKREHD